LKWISARDLEQWSKVISARDVLPAMVADLIRASAQDIASFRFLSDDKGQVRGFDGHLEAAGSPRFVPDGVSIWEFGVSEGVRKANSDYQKRVKQVSPEERANITFVFVTLQTWDSPRQKLQDWESGKRKRNEWKDVRYIDGMKLEHWLDEHPAVAAQYARTVLGVFPILGVLGTDEFWNDYSDCFTSQLTEDVLLCEREKQAENLLTQLGKETGQITICADSPDEVIAFAIASIRKADPQVKTYLEARTLIIESDEAARFLCQKRGLVFFPRGQAHNFAGRFAQSGPTLVAIGADRPNQNHETLLRPSSSNLGKAIATMGFEDDKAYDLARKCGRSITVLRRRLAGSAAPKPEWMTDGRMLPQEPDEPTKEKQNRARAGYQLLRSFKLVPGLGGDALDAAVLRAWIVEVRRRGAEEDRLVIAEQHIGHVLAHAQLLDPDDGAWPHRGVRGVLEALDSEQIERGIVTERINMRGAHFKALYEGGEQERELAKQCRAWADTALAWPRTAALLENIAESWERDADAADVRARQDKMRE
jgi:hypothetical protein